MLCEESLRAGSLEFRNRIFMPAMAAYKDEPGGYVGQVTLDHYRERVAGGNLGLVVSEHLYVSPRGRARDNQLGIDSDARVEGLARLAEVFHQAGTPVFAQINHCGSGTFRRVVGEDPWSPSGISTASLSTALAGGGLGDEEPPHEMTTEDIGTVIGEFTQAAVRAKEAGFDGVELHSAHAYLLNQFYCPLTNRRDDEWGGDVAGRVRIHVELIKSIHTALGDDYPVAVRLGGCDYREDGTGSTIEDAIEACVLFERAGACLIDLSGGLCRFQRPGHTEPGYFKDMSREVKAAVGVPVLVAGGVKTIEQAEELLQEGVADMIGIGRALLANAHWADEAFA
ncbi:MAG: NADH:flavin oxidoreductase [Olsenella sp.]|nr:NADH:flavin oxidoreductase [Olsenella sp.]